MPSPVKLLNSFSIEKARVTQAIMSQKVVRQDIGSTKIRLVTGVDVAYTEDRSIGAAVTLDYHTLRLTEAKTSCVKTKMPYIPTLLAFRETYPAVSAIS